MAALASRDSVSEGILCTHAYNMINLTISHSFICSVGPPLRKQVLTGRALFLTLTQLEGCFLSPSPSSVSKLLSGFKTYTAGGFTPPLAPPPRPLAPLPPASPATPTQIHHSHCTHPVSSARSTEPMVSFPGIALADRGRPLHVDFSRSLHVPGGWFRGALRRSPSGARVFS